MAKPLLFSFLMLRFVAIGWGLCLGAVWIPLSTHAATDHDLDRLVRLRIDQGDWVGAQYAIGRGGRLATIAARGSRTPGRATEVDDETLFCIGSVSKPVVVAGMMVLADQYQIDLNQNVDHWLKGFGSLRLVGRDDVIRAPTLRELMSHRGGIYSQKRGLTPRQRELIYLYDHPLDEAVRGIGDEALIFEPGTDYAYSGAGYCVLGHAMEKVLGQPLEMGLRALLLDPLGMGQSTYFPKERFEKIATGGLRQNNEWVPHPGTPHRTEPHLMTLVGGSLYSTARDLSTFALMICDRGQDAGKVILSEARWNEMLKQQAAGQSYALGWSVRWESKVPVELSHGGAIAASRALLRVHLPTRNWVIVLYTLSDPRAPATQSQQRELGQVTQRLVRSIRDE